MEGRTRDNDNGTVVERQEVEENLGPINFQCSAAGFFGRRMELVNRRIEGVLALITIVLDFR